MNSGIRGKTVLKIKSLLKTLSALLLSMFVAVFGFFYYQTHPELWPAYRDAQKVIAGIEAFRREHHRLPGSIAEIEPRFDSDAGPIYYERTSETEYVVFFGTSLGESYDYESSTGAW